MGKIMNMYLRSVPLFPKTHKSSKYVLQKALKFDEQQFASISGYRDTFYSCILLLNHSLLICGAHTKPIYFHIKHNTQLCCCYYYGQILSLINELLLILNVLTHIGTL